LISVDPVVAVVAVVAVLAELSNRELGPRAARTGPVLAC